MNFYYDDSVDGEVSLVCDNQNCHETSLSNLMYHKVVHMPYEASISSGLAFDVYPTKELYNLHHTNTPWMMSMWSIIMVLLASIIFLVYDHFVKVESITKQHIMESRRRLVRFVSHEIRTPLNTVVLGLQLLYNLISTIDVDVRDEVELDDCESDEVCSDEKIVTREHRGSRDHRKEDLSLLMDAESSTCAAVMVLNDLLDYDEIEMDTLEINLQPVNAFEFLKSSIQQFNIQARQAQIHMKVNLYQSLRHLDSPTKYMLRNTTRDSPAISTRDGMVALTSFCFMADRHRLMQVF